MTKFVQWLVFLGALLVLVGVYFLSQYQIDKNG